MTELISDHSDTRLDIYARMNEPQLKTIYEPKEGLFIAESPMVIMRALDAGYIPESVLTCREALKGHGKEVTERIGFEFPDVPVYIGSDEALREIRGYQLTRGVLCAMKRKPMPKVCEILHDKKRVVLLEDIENPGNVGAIFRSAAAMFMDGVLLTKNCSDPLYRRSARVSVGTVFNIPWTFTDMDFGLFKEYGFKTVAMALKNESISVSDPCLRQEDKLLIVMGNEGCGLKQETIDNCDYTVKIPMAEGVDSLNVAAASAVAFYVLYRRDHYADR